MGAMFGFIKGCTKCGGDLVFDEGDWRCWQCGQYYYMTPADSSTSHPLPLEEQAPPTASEGPQGSASVLHPDQMTQEERPRRRRRRKGYGPRSERNIDAVVRARQVSDERWWSRNRQVIEYLDQGLSVKEIARLVGRGERQIRVIRERLADLRAAAQGKSDS